MPTDKEKTQKIQEKHQAVLTTMLRDDDNKYCVDCDAKGPRWASWNLGIFLCIRCAGIHRNLGVHISKVKSVNLDQWTAEQIASMQAMGNSKGRAVYEANLPDNYRRPQSDQSLEQFIRTKYEQRRWIAKEWIPPNITISPDLTDEEPAKDKRKSVNAPANADSEKKTTISAKKLNTVSIKAQQPATPEIKVQNDTFFDLLGLNDIPNTTTSIAPTAQPISSSKQLEKDLFGDFISSGTENNDSGWEAIFPEPLSSPALNQPTGPAVSPNLLGNDDEFSLKSVFNQHNKPPSFDKDSILKLYNSNQPTIPNGIPPLGQQMFSFGNPNINFGVPMVNQQIPAQQFNAVNFQKNNMTRPPIQNNQAFNAQLNGLQMQMNNMNLNANNTGANAWPNQNQMQQANMPNLFNTTPTNNNIGFPNAFNANGNTLSTNLWQ